MHILHVKSFRLLKINKFTARNNSTARKQANSARGIIPIVKSTCRQSTEFFRLPKVSADSLRNYSVCWKYANSPCGIFRTSRTGVEEHVKVFARTKNVLGRQLKFPHKPKVRWARRKNFRTSWNYVLPNNANNIFYPAWFRKPESRRHIISIKITQKLVIEKIRVLC